VRLLGVIDVQVSDRGRWRRVTFYAEPEDPEVKTERLARLLSLLEIWRRANFEPFKKKKKN
jgi:hypothetical protein